MSRESDEELESQSKRAQEATPGGVEEPGGRWQERARTQYREWTSPVRAGLRHSREWFDKLPPPARWALTAALIAAAAVVPFVLNHALGITAPYWMSIVTKMGTAALLALGLNVVVGFAGLLDLGYVAFFAVGAYTFAILTGASRYNIAVFNQVPGAAALKPEWHMYMWLFFFAAIA